MTKLGDLYQALLDGHLIKIWDDGDESYKIIKFDQDTQMFTVSPDGVEHINTTSSVNKLFLSKCEIYKPPTERLWIYYDYNDKSVETYVGLEFIPIAQERTDEYGYKWVKTEEVR